MYQGNQFAGKKVVAKYEKFYFSYVSGIWEERTSKVTSPLVGRNAAAVARSARLRTVAPGLYTGLSSSNPRKDADESETGAPGGGATTSTLTVSPTRSPSTERKSAYLG